MVAYWECVVLYHHQYVLYDAVAVRSRSEAQLELEFIIATICLAEKTVLCIHVGINCSTTDGIMWQRHVIMCMNEMSCFSLDAIL